MSALVVTGLTKSFGSTQVLRGVDLEVSEGVTAVLGASGCGKTTLLRTVAGFLAPDAGTITIGGTVVAEPGRSLPPRRRRIGYVPQEGALFPHLDVAGNVGFGLGREARRPSRVTELLDLVELPPSVAGRFPHELSGGQQQRVALARALAPSPELVLLDEPFSSLDAGLREETGRSVVRAVRASGAAAVLVTHDQGEALSLADQVAVMEAGRFVQVAAPAQLYVDPATPRVAAFVGSVTLLPAEAADGVARCELGEVAVADHLRGTVMLAVRPEQVGVLPVGAPGVAAVVMDVSYFGHDAVLRAKVPGGTAVVRARVPAAGIPAVGELVRLSVTGVALAFQEQP